MRGFVYLFAFRVMYVVFLFQPLQRAQPFTSLGWALIYGVIYTRCITVNSVLTTSFKLLQSANPLHLVNVKLTVVVKGVGLLFHL